MSSVPSVIENRWIFLINSKVYLFYVFISYANYEKSQYVFLTIRSFLFLVLYILLGTCPCVATGEKISMFRFHINFEWYMDRPCRVKGSNRDLTPQRRLGEWYIHLSDVNVGHGLQFKKLACWQQCDKTNWWITYMEVQIQPFLENIMIVWILFPISCRGKSI
jgi:hypothetical protein